MNYVISKEWCKSHVQVYVCTLIDMVCGCV